MADKPGSGGGVQQGVGGNNPRGFPAPDRSGFTYLGVTPQSTSKLMDGLDGIVTSLQAANQESQKIYKEMHASAEMTARAMGSVLDRAEQLMMMVTKSNGQGITALTTSGAGFDTGGSVAGLSGSGIPTAPSHGGHGEGGRAAGVDGGEWHPTQRLLPGSFREGKAMHLGDLRSGVAERVGHSIQNWGTGMKQEYRHRDPVTNKVHYASRLVPKGSPLYRDAEVEMTPGWRGTAVTAVKSGVGSVAEGGTFMEGLGGVLPTVGVAAGIAGAAYAGINWGLNTAEDQRAKNARYQAILGGSNASQWGERFGEMGFRWSMRGTMSGGEADAIYKNAAENFAGNRGARSEYQDAAVRLYRQLGMGATDETIPILNAVAQTGNTHLNELADTLVKLGKAAQVAGISAKKARQDYMAEFQTLDGVSAGPVQVAAASYLSQAKMNMGKAFGYLNTQGQTDTLGTVLAANRAGISTSAYEAATRYNTPVMVNGTLMTGDQLLAYSSSGFEQTAKRTIDPNGVAQRFLAKYAKDHWHGQTPNQQQLDEAAGALELAHPEFQGQRIGGTWRTIVRDNTTNVDAPGRLVRSILNDSTDPYKIQQDEAARIKSQMSHTVQFHSRLSKRAGSYVDNTASKDALRWVNENLGQTAKRGTRVSDLDYAANGRDGVANALSLQALSGERVNPVGMQIYNQYDKLGSGTRVLVHTKGGMRSFELGEAIAQFGDQLQERPDLVKIQGGMHDGESLAKALGVHGDLSKRVSEMDSYDASQKHKGLSPAKGRKSAMGDTTRDGTVTIRLAPGVDQWLRTHSTGSARDATQRPAPASQSGASTQPSGN